MKISLTEPLLIEGSDYLARQDPALASVLQKYGYPPLWARSPGFPSLIHIILEQQVSLASASAVFRKLESAVGNLTPANFLNINDEDLLKFGFSRQKKQYARLLATVVLSGNFDFDALSQMEDSDLRAYMKTLKGVGDWTVDIYSLMCLLRPNVLPKGDLALYESYRVLYSLENRPTHEYFEANTLHWQPWRSVGARLLWHFYLCERVRK